MMKLEHMTAPELRALVKRQEAELAEVRASLPAAGAVLTDDQIMAIAWDFQAGGQPGKFSFIKEDLPHFARAILAAQPAAAAPDAQPEQTAVHAAIGKLIVSVSELEMLWGLDEPGALVRFRDVSNVLFAASKACREQAPAAAQPEAKATPDLCYVIHWLEGGCDPLEAARELRAYQKQIGQAPAAALESKAAPAPATLSDSHIKMIGYGEGIDSTVALRFARAILAAAGNSQDAKDSARLDFVLHRRAFILTVPKGRKSGDVAGYQLLEQDGDEDLHTISGEGVLYRSKREAIDAAMAPSAPVGGSHG